MSVLIRVFTTTTSFQHTVTKLSLHNEIYGSNKKLQVYYLIGV